MVSSDKTKQPTKRIGIAIEMGIPFGHHHGSYKGILDYIRENRPDWQTIVDPYMTGLSDASGRAQYDGIVGRITADAGKQAKTLGVPVVNHWMNAPDQDLPSVFADYKENGRIVAEHFLERGYHRIGLVSWETDRARALYLAGLQEVAEERGIEVQTLDVPYSFEDDPDLFVEFYDQLRETLQGVTPPIGIYVPMDGMALYLVQLCDELGLRMPHEVGIAVAYNSLEICLNTRPTLTSIEANDEKIGYEAMRLLDQLINKTIEPPDEPLLIKPRSLRVRGSSEVFVSDDPVVSSAMRYIAEHARQAITVEDVAQAASVSKRTLSRRFNEHVGQSVLSEISRIRVQAIKQALVDTELPMSEVSESCGFTSTSHFNVFFRKATGMTPGEYRKQHRYQA